MFGTKTKPSEIQKFLDNRNFNGNGTTAQQWREYLISQNATGNSLYALERSWLAGVSGNAGSFNDMLDVFLGNNDNLRSYLKNNLYTNTFEQGIGDASTLQFNAVTNTFSIDTTTFAKGKQSLKLAIVTGGDSQNWSAQLALPSLNLKNGKTYAIKYSIKANADRVVSVGFEGDTAYYPDGHVATTDWVEFEDTIVATADSLVTPKFLLNTGVSGTVWIDRIEFNIV